MKTKGMALVLLLAVLVGLPGCGPMDKMKSKKKAQPKTSFRMQDNKENMAAGDEFSDVNVPLADADSDLSDESLQSFFNEMEEFVVFNDDADAADGQFTWKDADDKRLETVYFEIGKHKIDEDQLDKIEYNSEEAKKILADAKEVDPRAKLVIEGHSSPETGSPEFNFALSEKRAKEVADRFAAAGISRDDMKVVGRGAQMPILKDGTREEHWVDRRVELHVVSA